MFVWGLVLFGSLKGLTTRPFREYGLIVCVLAVALTETQGMRGQRGLWSGEDVPSRCVGCMV